MSASVHYIFDGTALRVAAPDPVPLTTRVALGAVSESARLVLELDTTEPGPLVRRLAEKLDEIRTLMLAGELYHIDALTLLLKTVREERELYLGAEL